MTEDKISSAAAALDLKDGQQQQPSQVQGPERPSVGDTIAAMMPELSPGRAMTSGMTLDETLADLKKSPLFMDELDMENEDVKALQALAYEGTPLENAANFKEQGNECFREKRWFDAKEFYGKGIAILADEETKRKRKAAGLPPLPTATAQQKQQKEGADSKLTKEDEAQVDALDAKQSVGKEFKLAESKKDQEQEKENKQEEEEDPADIPKQLALLEQLYVNRAACHLELKNYRSCTLDCAHALRLNPRNIKAFYRSSKALLAVSRVEEALDSCTRGLQIDPSNKALQQISSEITKKAAQVSAKKAAEDALLAKQSHEQRLLETALKARNILPRKSTGKPPDMEDAHVCLVPDPSDPQSTLAFPTLLLYPLHYESDFIKAFNEMESLEQHFGYVFPLPWDREGIYSANGVECYMETVSGGLVKVGKKVPLLKVLGGGNVEVVDELLKIFVVPRGKAEAWVKDFKEKNKKGGNWKGK
ncbi:hypothetical protein V8F20_009470 [Naviculisporaceae sp. PSN 640]